MQDESWRPGGCWSTKTSNMLVLMLASGLGGAFFYYSLLRGLRLGKVSKGPALWVRCVAACAMMLAVCGSIIVRYFYEDAPYTLTLALWPAFILALEPGYRVASLDVKETESDES